VASSDLPPNLTWHCWTALSRSDRSFCLISGSAIFSYPYSAPVCGLCSSRNSTEIHSYNDLSQNDVKRFDNSIKKRLQKTGSHFTKDFWAKQKKEGMTERKKEKQLLAVMFIKSGANPEEYIQM
jgi:hypothetical protein